MSTISVDAPRATSARRSPRALLRAVADAAVSPLTVDDLLDHFHPLRGGTGPEQVQGRIVEVRAETAEAATVVIKPGRDWAGHLPGQYVRVGVDVDGVRMWRCYSLTHGPRRDGRISITVKAIPGGTVSNHLVHAATAGQIVQLAQAEGEFVLNPAHRQLLLVTGGSGITPVIGMLRNLFSKAQPEDRYDIVLVHSALTHDDVIFGAELRAHAGAGRIRLIERHTDTDGLLTTADLDAEVPDLADRVAYACGPAGLLDTLEAFYDERGLSLYTERFRPPASDITAEGGTVTFGRTGLDIEADGSTPILDAAENA
ncbi:MAG TPA: ferredoxin reductase, partial [Nocardioides sp.]|nr:ferredoxin reductase [Nocardioides sp.]